MERLTERDSCDLYGFKEVNCRDICADNVCHLGCPIQNAIDKLKVYEDLEERGKLLRLPYPLETRYVYAIDDDDIIRLNAMDLSIGEDLRSRRILYTVDGMDYYYEEFGEIVFLTQQEAEAALEKVKGEERETD